MLQEGLTDEMVELARQLKESSLLMNQSVQETKKVGFFFLILTIDLFLSMDKTWQTCKSFATARILPG